MKARPGALLPKGRLGGTFDHSLYNLHNGGASLRGGVVGFVFVFVLCERVEGWDRYF